MTTIEKNLLKISHLARRAGVSIPTVKHYVRKGLLSQPVKTSRNMAYYREADIDRIRLIKRLQREQYLPLDVIKQRLGTSTAMNGGSKSDDDVKAARVKTGTASHPAALSIIQSRPPDLKDIRRAATRIGPLAHRTPVMTCESLDRMTGAGLFFKCENFQKVGAFKFRGAVNAVLSLTPEQKKRGVVTHSSGNHAQALALAARMQDMQAYIVMPGNAPDVKIAAVRDYGAEVILCRPTLDAREAGVRDVIQNTGAELIHPYDDGRVIAGQATCAMEFFEQAPGLDIVMAPVGGGGLLSGTALAARFFSPQTRVMAAEPELADDACRSFREKKLLPAGPARTIADGLLTSLGDITFRVVLKHVDEILTVKEENIVAAMRFIWERMKIVVEPSGAVPLGAVLEHPELFTGQKVGIILSGGNVDLQKMQSIFCSTRLRR